MNAAVKLRQPIEVLEQEDVVVDVARTLNDLLEVCAIRAVVYMGEQFCPFDEEFDGNDFAGSTHLVARAHGRIAGVLRIRFFADFVKIERVAVLDRHRGGTVAVALLEAAYDLAARKGYKRLIGYVQERLLPYWSRTVGVRERVGRPQFVFSDHRYIEVERQLNPPEEALHIDSDPMILIRPEGAWERPGILDASSARSAMNPC
jgi:predicted GNAT family N-acyltransferase